jgi:hypothetical protein
MGPQGRGASARARPSGAPRLLFVVTEDWFFLSLFLPMAMAARDAGYHVAIAARVQEGRGAIEAHGFQLYDALGPRGAFGPTAALRDAIGLYRAMLEFRPDIVHLVALRAWRSRRDHRANTGTRACANRPRHALGHRDAGRTAGARSRARGCAPFAAAPSLPPPVRECR